MKRNLTLPNLKYWNLNPKKPETMNVLIAYTDNLFTDWSLYAAGVNKIGITERESFQFNAKQEQVVNDLKTLYNTAYSVYINDKEESCLKVCEHIYNRMHRALPTLADHQFNFHLCDHISMQTSFQ